VRTAFGWEDVCDDGALPYPPGWPDPWHRLFGIALTDLFTGRPWRVELEKELALKNQRLDVLIIERLPGDAASSDPAALADLPDGLENLPAHNVLSYKFKQEPLDGLAMEELIGHYVTYRKLASIQALSGPSAAEPPADPVEPAPAAARLLPTAAFRLYAVATRHPAKLFAHLPPGTQSPTERMDVADRLRGLDPEERLRGLGAEEILRRFDPEERLRGLDPEQVKAWLKRTGH